MAFSDAAAVAAAWRPARRALNIVSDINRLREVNADVV